MTENKCPQCGAPLDPGATECKFCGEKIATQQAAQSGHSQVLSWQDRYGYSLPAVLLDGYPGYRGFDRRYYLSLLERRKLPAEASCTTAISTQKRWITMIHRFYINHKGLTKATFSVF